MVNYSLGFNCCRYSPGKYHILCIAAAVPVAWVMVAPPAETSSNIFRRTDQLWWGARWASHPETIFKRSNTNESYISRIDLRGDHYHKSSTQKRQHVDHQAMEKHLQYTIQYSRAQ